MAAQGCFGRTDDSGGCSTDAECNDATLRCDAGSCVSKCAGVVCNTGQTCEPTTGSCVGNGGCTVDADCDPNGDLGHVCNAGTCAAGVYGDCSVVACLCGPQLAQYGYQSTPFRTSCDATLTGAGGGFCLGPLADFGTTSSPLEVGLCMAIGSLAAGSSCPTNATQGDPANLCVSGLCVAETSGAITGVCWTFCTLLDGTLCTNDATGPTSCTSMGGMAGICSPRSTSPASVGAACTPSTTEEACVEDSTCYDPAGGTNTTCVRYCDIRTGACPTGTCNPTSTNSSNILGVCL